MINCMTIYFWIIWSVITILPISMVLRFKNGNMILRIIKSIGCLLLFLFAEYIIQKYCPLFLSVISDIAILLLISVILYDGSLLRKINICIMMGLTSAVSVFAIKLLYGSQDALNVQTNGFNGNYPSMSKIFLFTILICFVVQFAVSVILMLALKKLNKIISFNNHGMIVFLLLLMMAFISLLILGYEINNESLKNIFWILLILLFVFEHIYAAWILLKLLFYERERIELESFMEQIKKEIGNMEIYEKQLEEIRMLKHEMRNEYIVLKELIGSGKYGDAVKIITNITHDSEENIGMVPVINTGSPMIDVVISYFDRRFRKNCIGFDCAIEKGVPVKSNEEELCTVLFNLLKNAYEAELTMKEGKVRLELKKEKNYITVLVGNTIESSVLEVNAGLKTTKGSTKEHGFGIKVCKKIAEQSQGEFRVFEENGEFICLLWMRAKTDLVS